MGLHRNQSTDERMEGVASVADIGEGQQNQQEKDEDAVIFLNRISLIKVINCFYNYFFRKI